MEEVQWPGVMSLTLGKRTEYNYILEIGALVDLVDSRPPSTWQGGWTRKLGEAVAKEANTVSPQM